MFPVKKNTTRLFNNREAAKPGFNLIMFADRHKTSLSVDLHMNEEVRYSTLAQMMTVQLSLTHSSDMTKHYSIIKSGSVTRTRTRNPNLPDRVSKVTTKTATI